jgi:import inner membrane translocase subunit TIM22
VSAIIGVGNSPLLRVCLVGPNALVGKFLGEKDVWNAAMGGCFTGAAMSAKQGPQAMAFGCGGFVAFSLVADQVMESMDMH